jgi:hypothetical protein
MAAPGQKEAEGDGESVGHRQHENTASESLSGSRIDLIANSSSALPGTRVRRAGSSRIGRTVRGRVFGTF